MTTREAVQTLGDEFSEHIRSIEDTNPHDELVIVYTGGTAQIDWKGALAVYVVIANQNTENPVDVIAFDDERLDILRNVMYSMNEPSYEVIKESRERTVTKLDEDGNLIEVIETVTVTILKITITQRASDEMIAYFSFTDKQKKALGELLSPEYDSIWEELLGGFALGGGSGIPWAGRVPKGPFTWPLEIPGTVTSYFGWREDPFTGETKYHGGVDIVAKTGTKILAAADGVVTIANGSDSYGGGWGYYVKLSHAGGYETLYAHCSAVAARTGDTVRRGQVVGYIGSTGRSKGPHLHWEVYENGSLKDPLAFFE
jgi:murein DD-endopeptidase MepM/ murein hydrolase activator NlpD